MCLFFLYKSLCFKFLFHFWTQELHIYFTMVPRKFICSQKDSTDFKKMKIAAIKDWTISSSIFLFRFLLCTRYVAIIMNCLLTSTTFHVNWYWLGFQGYSKSKTFNRQSLTSGATRPRDLSCESGFVRHCFVRFNRTLVSHHMLQIVLFQFTVC